MPEQVDSTTVQFVDASGRERASVRVLAGSTDTGSGKPAPLLRLSDAEARENGEEIVQLLEDYTYEYVVQGEEEFRLRDGMGGTSVVNPRSTRDGEGDLKPRRHVGMVPLRLVDKQGGTVAKAAIEVRSRKLGYRDDYREMLDDIVDASMGLVSRARGPSQARLETSFGGTAPRELGQRFAFLRSVIDDRGFKEARAQILANPHEESRRVEQKRDPRRGTRAARSALRDLASGTPRAPLPESHPMAGKLPSVPTGASQQVVKNTVDTAENRFVKHVISTFERVLFGMLESLREAKSPDDWNSADERLAGEIRRLRDDLNRTLRRDIFRSLSSLDRVPTRSTVLQRRSGYREVLQAWLRFNAAIQISSWDGGDEVFGGGQKDVAALYEYWLFFKLREIVSGLFDLAEKEGEDLVEKTGDKFDLKLKAGENLNLKGTTGEEDGDPRQLVVRLSYNRTFSRATSKSGDISYPDTGSWTRRLRPDYTLSLWPAGTGEEEISEEEAEKLELATHLHFDAKYRVKGVKNLFGDDSDDGLDKDKEAQRSGKRARSADLKRAHAYRDAIRRSEGAYILFPGTQEQSWREYREILPGLGAFPVVPGGEDPGVRVREFLERVKQNLQDRATNREATRYHLERIHSSRAQNSAVSTLPELESAGEREMPPSELTIAYDLDAEPAGLRWLNDHAEYPLYGPGLSAREVAGAHLFAAAPSGGSPPQLCQISSVEIVTGDALEDSGYKGEARDEDALMLVHAIPDERYTGVSSWDWQERSGTTGTCKLADIVPL